MCSYINNLKHWEIHRKNTHGVLSKTSMGYGDVTKMASAVQCSTRSMFLGISKQSDNNLSRKVNRRKSEYVIKVTPG